MRKWLKKLFSKKRPPCIVCEEQEGELQLNETDWICENCAQKLCMKKVLKEMNSTLYILFHI